MLFSGPHFGPGLLLLIGGRIAAIGQPQGGRQAWQGRAGQGQQQGRAGPTAGPQGAHGAQQQGRSASAPLRIASGGPQQGRRGNSAGRARRASQGLSGAAGYRQAIESPHPVKGRGRGRRAAR